MTLPAYTRDEALAREVFLALMWSLSYPGRTVALPVGITLTADAFDAAAHTLLDLESSYFTPDEALAARLARTGARALPPERADYHFYPALDLDTARRASPGTMLYPDQAATLFVGCTFGSGQVLILSGPGVPVSVAVRVDGIAPEFWALRKQVGRYPLGWDIYLVDGGTVLGLPRTTTVTLA